MHLKFSKAFFPSDLPGDQCSQVRPDIRIADHQSVRGVGIKREKITVDEMILV
jgi:hypothetical protein